MGANTIAFERFPFDFATWGVIYTRGLESHQTFEPSSSSFLLHSGLPDLARTSGHETTVAVCVAVDRRGRLPNGA